MPKNNSNKGFRIVGILTIVAVYLLIFVGGLVRSTGSGMGCPDWPKCFGQYVPPTSKEELPSNYKEIYAEKRFQKNQRLAKMLYFIGFDQTAKQLINDPSLYVEADFNPVKTWIEYINRLVGVSVGILIFLLVIFSIPYLKFDPTVFWMSLIGFILVVFEGWLGSLVVSTNLLPFMVSVHMGFAIILVLVLLYGLIRAFKGSLPVNYLPNKGILKSCLIIIVVATFIQIIIGTQVREEIDVIASRLGFEQRDLWVGELGSLFNFHRTFSIVLILLHLIYLYIIVNKSGGQYFIKNLSVAVVLVLMLSLFTGIVLNYAGMPAFIQPVHLLLATILVGLQYLLYVLVIYSEKDKKELSINVS